MDFQPINTAPLNTPIRVRYPDGTEADAIVTNATGGIIVTADRDLRGKRPSHWAHKEPSK